VQLSKSDLTTAVYRKKKPPPGPQVPRVDAIFKRPVSRLFFIMRRFIRSHVDESNRACHYGEMRRVLNINREIVEGPQGQEVVGIPSSRSAILGRLWVVRRAYRGELASGDGVLG
jgi:hypothetical protein